MHWDNGTINQFRGTESCQKGTGLSSLFRKSEEEEVFTWTVVSNNPEEYKTMLQSVARGD